MPKFVSIDTPAGMMLAEVDDTVGFVGGIPSVLTAGDDHSSKSFKQTIFRLRENAEYLRRQLEELGPQEITVECGLKIGAIAGTPIFGLAKVSGESSYTVKLRWSVEEQK